MGSGKHADIFKAFRVLDLKSCIIRPAKQVGRPGIEQEIKILLSLKGGPNILELEDIVRDDQMGTPSLVFEYVENTDFRRLYPAFGDGDARYYMKELLKALQFCHGRSIMHRNVQPHNIMIDHGRRKLRLFGWEYSAAYVASSRYSVRVGQGFAKAPELLLQHEEYDCSLDIWNTGVILASVIFRKEPFFHGISSFHLLQMIASVLGTKGLLNYVEKYDIETTPDDVDAIPYFEKREWRSFIDERNEQLSSSEAMDLVDKLLQWDHKQRLTATEALNHPYFS
ncbi:casein kinase II, alpha subunit [Trichoderma reesei QM6a]|uniref:non-specific serine/threonine protein kinase n=1 Tax=Hypocrea jecorina (strain QM6a) TaxID=431241 RepID=G0RRS3_HYPJQ|nr:casein kinase II, alpha subunit [Trichoderma reesei QM6a]EGR46199.1 casein kinase II, alpha subunit [Trichoderma reesei QM6a]